MYLRKPSLVRPWKVLPGPTTIVSSTGWSAISANVESPCMPRSWGMLSATVDPSLSFCPELEASICVDPNLLLCETPETVLTICTDPDPTLSGFVRLVSNLSILLKSDVSSGHPFEVVSISERNSSLWFGLHAPALPIPPKLSALPMPSRNYQLRKDMNLHPMSHQAMCAIGWQSKLYLQKPAWT